MTDGAQAALLPDGRLHLHHGPIDLIISAEGPACDAAFDVARVRFGTVLEEVTAELASLTQAYADQTGTGRIPKRMIAAVAPLADHRFVTPMAAVAGAIADEICEGMTRGAVTKAVVNNGGDIAFFLTEGQNFQLASPHGAIVLDASSPVRGVATSGWRGRSQSFGIADAVTVLAESAARADAAATLIANAVDLPDHPAITRRPAHEVEAIPQLGARHVTADVGALSKGEIATALEAGTRYGETLIAKGLIFGALLLLKGETRVIGSADSATRLPAHRS